VNPDGAIVHAEAFDGWTVFARLKSVPQIVGMRLEEIVAKPEQLPVSPKLQTAFLNAARDLRKARLEGKEVATPADNGAKALPAVGS
jgi:hypothetical protein